MENRVREERDRFHTMIKSENKDEQQQAVAQVTPTFTINDKFELRKELSCYTLLVELSVPIDYVLLQVTYT